MPLTIQIEHRLDNTEIGCKPCFYFKAPGMSKPKGPFWTMDDTKAAIKHWFNGRLTFSVDEDGNLLDLLEVDK